MQALCKRRFIPSAHDHKAAGMYATILPSDRPFSSPAHSCLMMAFEDSSTGALGGLAWVGIERAAQASSIASLTDETPLQISTVEAKDFAESFGHQRIYVTLIMTVAYLSCLGQRGRETTGVVLRTLRA